MRGIMIDPRPDGIIKKLASVERVLVFASGKGGVGKSTCATVAALDLARSGRRTGLLDLDFQGASAHVLLGAEPTLPDESRGILPLKLDFGLELMSIAGLTGENPVPLRGSEVSNALVELLAVTVWGALEFLIVDMPPGIGDEVLDLMRFLQRSEFVIVSTPSRVTVPVVQRLLIALNRLDARVLGVLENMAPVTTESSSPHGYPCTVLGRLPFCPQLEAAVGSPQKLLETPFARRLADQLSVVIERP